MQTRTLELRDRNTFIPIIAVAMKANTAGELYLLRRAGYSPDQRLIMLTRLDGGDKAHYDPFGWKDRTFHSAHIYIQDNWDTLVDGEVIDVEFILGETSKPKISEQFEGLKMISADEFELLCGRKPEQDDLERVNCPDAGRLGHQQCGWCTAHACPVFECGGNHG